MVMSQFKKGDKIYFRYSKYFPYHEGIITRIDNDGVCSVRFKLPGCPTKNQSRRLHTSQLYKEKPLHVRKMEEQRKAEEQRKWNRMLKFYKELEELVKKYNLKAYLDIDHPWLNKIEIPVKETFYDEDDYPYYFAIDEYPELYNFLEKNGKLGKTVNLVPVQIN